ncbi:MAG TPA: hypothetical protein VMD53_04590 [Rhizomicrobium sp.]|nr:hypothetical protein [Rhizomicrobium sp.]
MIDAVVSAVLLLIVGYGYYRPWQNICTDIARQVIFEKRDALFDMAASGELSFNDRNYQVIRKSLEDYIRLAHELTIWKHMISRASLRRAGVKVRKTDLDTAIAAIPNNDTRAKVQLLVNQSHQTLLGIMFLKSPALLMILLPIIAFVVFKAIITATFNRLNGRLNDLGNQLQVDAELCRQDSN